MKRSAAIVKVIYDRITDMKTGAFCQRQREETHKAGIMVEIKPANT